MEKLISTAEAASTIGCAKSTVIRVAKRLNVGRIVGRSMVLTEDEVKVIAAEARDGPGCPLFVVGNTLSPHSKNKPKKAVKKAAKKKKA